LGVVGVGVQAFLASRMSEFITRHTAMSVEKKMMSRRSITPLAMASNRDRKLKEVMVSDALTCYYCASSSFFGVDFILILPLSPPISL
jgi:F420-0:gamma-glutamyl ligase-like protein